MSEKPETGWLLIKRDLYWRPDAMGYTGLKSIAGRYTYEEAHAWCDHGRSNEVKMIHESEAPEVRASCYSDIRDKYYLEELARLRTALTEIRDRELRMSFPWTHEKAADEYMRMRDADRNCARAALEERKP
jgi:hypothetical protein